jgi:hypothetical protein
MLADAGMGFKKEEANHDLDNNQRPDVIIVDGKSNRSQMAISVANTLSAHRQDSQEKEIKRWEKSKHTKY